MKQREITYKDVTIILILAIVGFALLGKGYNMNGWYYWLYSIPGFAFGISAINYGFKFRRSSNGNANS